MLNQLCGCKIELHTAPDSSNLLIYGEKELLGKTKNGLFQTHGGAETTAAVAIILVEETHNVFSFKYRKDLQ